MIVGGVHALAWEAVNCGMITVRTLFRTTQVVFSMVVSVGALFAQVDVELPAAETRMSVASGIVTRSLDAVKQAPLSVRTLDLSRQRLRDFPSEIVACENLTSLTLSNNELASLPDDLATLAQLRTIILTGNRFVRVPDVLTKMPWLQVLIMRNNEIRSLVPLSAITELATLDLQGNPLDSIADDAFTGLKNLRVLDLSRTKLKRLPASVGGCSLLSDLRVSQASLTKLPQSIGKLQALQTLDVSGNALTELTDAILECSNLQSINVSKNKIKALPGGLYRLRTLQTLKANSNLLTALPDTLTSTALRIIEVDSNKIVSVSPSIGMIVHLDRFSARNNLLSTLPTAIGQCKNLSILDVSGNRIVALPVAELANIPGLTRITIANSEEAMKSKVPRGEMHNDSSKVAPTVNETSKQTLPTGKQQPMLKGKKP